MKRSLVILTSLAILAISTPMFAATASAPLNISAQVVVNCTITTTPVNFGIYDTIAGTAVPGTGTVDVACTKGASGLTIDLNNGLNSASAVGTTRAMNSGTNYLSYDLYTDAGHSALWSTGFAIANAPNKNVRAFTVYGLIAANQDAAVGVYADVVTATINY